SMSSLRTNAGGPAGTWTMRMPLSHSAISGRRSLSRRATTATPWTSSASCLATWPTETVSPPETSPPSTHSTEACPPTRGAQQLTHAGNQLHRVGVQITADAVLDDGDHFRRGQPDDGHADHHRLQHRQAEAGVTDGVEEEPIGRLERGQLRRLDLAQAAHFLRTHADHVERQLFPDAREHV